ncbi:hypothetical protein BY458DRAFT_555017 [Sporodiniella umbellata]|nr:hypothetical protein BY458DRAFT_555017 [Sporodiniella umbellata]
MSHSPPMPRALPIVYEENDPYRAVKKSPKVLDSDSSEFDAVHSRTASDSSTSKLYHPTIDYDDPYHKRKPKQREKDRANSYLPYSHHRRDPAQSPPSTMYIEEYIPRASTTLGVGSMLQESYVEPMSPPAPRETPRMIIEELPKKKGRRTCCGLPYRTLALITLLWVAMIVIIWYFVWPRVPNLTIVKVADETDIKVITNSTKKSISTQWNVTVSADNFANWVPTRFHSIRLQLEDTKTGEAFGSGSSGFQIFPPRQKHEFFMNVTIAYQTEDLNDTTFQHLYNACGVQISSNVPTENRQDALNVTLTATYDIVGIVWYPTRNITVRGLICPTS